MAPRPQLQSLLEEILGSRNVYFQPPTNVQIQYPCIVYKRQDLDSKFADNALYQGTFQYEVTVIDRNPDSDILAKIAALPMCRYDRFFTAENLNHDVFNLYFAGRK